MELGNYSELLNEASELYKKIPKKDIHILQQER